MMIGEGCTAYCPGNNVSAEDISVVKKILEESGVCEMVPENHINAVTALSGGGPAFVSKYISLITSASVINSKRIFSNCRYT